MNNVLLKSILAMDSYNRGYDSGIDLNTNRVGDAEILRTEVNDTEVLFDSAVLRDNQTGQRLDEEIGFYAVAYDYKGETIISYRGTDDVDSFLTDVILPTSLDVRHGWTLGAGLTSSEQGLLAVDFYQEVSEQKGLDVRSSGISLTGHSLGGGLSGYIAGLYDLDATVFDSMAFVRATNNAFRDSGYIVRYQSPSTFFESFVSAAELDAEIERINNNPNLVLRGFEIINSDLLERIYGTEDAWEVNFSGIEGHYIEGEILETMLPLRDGISELNAYTLGHEESLSGTDLHSAAALVIRLFAEEADVAAENNWAVGSQYFWPALFNDGLGQSIGADAIDLQGTLQDDGKFALILQNALAYSALDTDTGLIFGDTGIRALYDDANDLGSALLATDGLDLALHRDVEFGISYALVGYAGHLALNKIEAKKTLIDVTEGILHLEDGYSESYLTVDLDFDAWSAQQNDASLFAYEDAVHYLRQTLFATYMPFGSARDAIENTALELWGENPVELINSYSYGVDTTKTVVLNASDLGDGIAVFAASEGVSEKVQGSHSNDLIATQDGDDIIIGSLGEDVIDGGEGHDLLDYNALNSALTIDLEAGTVTNDLGQDSRVSSIEHVIGSRAADVITGSSGDDTLDGHWGVDTLQGGGGNDVLISQRDGGLDVLDGGAGDDLYYLYTSQAEQITDSSGNDTLLLNFWGGDIRDITRSRFNDQGRFFDAAEIETIAFVDGSTFQSTDLARRAEEIVFNDDAIIRDGYTFTGSAGNDSFAGFYGKDNLFIGDDGVDSVTYNIVHSTPDFTVDLALGVVSGLAAFDEGGSFIGYTGEDRLESIEAITALTDGDDVLYGDDGFNIFSSFRGDDTLYGRGGDDQLIDLNGYNSIYGGDGHDYIEGTGALYGGDGSDTILASLGIAYGEDGDDFLFAEAAGVTLDGGVGNDYFSDIGIGSLNNVNDTVYITGHSGDIDVVDGTGTLWLQSGSLETTRFYHAPNGSLRIETGDAKVIVKNHFDYDHTIPDSFRDFYAGSITQFSFDDGNTPHDIPVDSVIFAGTQFDDQFIGSDADNVYIAENAGNDIVYSRGGDNRYEFDLSYKNRTTIARNYLDGETPTERIVISNDGGISDIQIINDYNTQDGLLIRYGAEGVINLEKTFGLNFSNFVLEVNGQDYAFSDLTLTTVGTDNGDLFNFTGQYDVFKNDIFYGGAGADNFIGAEGDDTIFGGSGDDFITGADGSTYIDAGTGNDQIISGNGQDFIVVSRDADSLDTIFDFSVSDDVLDVSAFSNQYQTFEDVLALMTQDGSDVNVNLGANQNLIIANLNLGQLSGSNIDFDGPEPPNQTPLAVDDTILIDPFDFGFEEYFIIDVLENDFDPDGDALSVNILDVPEFGQVFLYADNTVEYFLDYSLISDDVLMLPDIPLALDSFTYSISDGRGGVSTATVNVTVDYPNQVPVAAIDLVSVDEDTAITIDFLANDFDPEGDDITLVSVGDASSGSYVLNADNTITYTADQDYFGDDQIVYQIEDSFGNLANGVIDITVNPVNDLPVLSNLAEIIDEDTNLSLNVLDGVVDVDGDALTLTNFTGAVSGSVTFDGAGNLSYTPDANFFGTETLSFTVSDGVGEDVTADLQIMITPVNDNPVAQNNTATTDQNQPVTLTAAQLLANDSDIDGDDLSIVAVSAAQNGTATLNSDGSVTFAPDNGFAGNASFEYEISDGQGGNAFASVSVTVNSTSDDVIAGGDGNDNLTGTFEGEVFEGGSGDDNVNARGGDDTINAGSGNDIVRAGRGDDIVSGGEDDDVIFGQGGDDLLYGDDGNDFIFAGQGDNVVYGGADNDVLAGGSSSDVVFGEDGDDVMLGNNGNDVLNGGSGNDRLLGGRGDDVLLFGEGDDLLIGGRGNDIFKAVDTENFGNTRISDFNLSDDALDISDILTDYDPVNDLLSDFVNVEVNRSRATVSIDRDGSGTEHAWEVLTQMQVRGGRISSDEDDLVNDGVLVI